MTRDRAAVACMSLGSILLVSSAALWAGVAAGMAVAGVLLVAVAVLLGWH